MLRPLSQLFFIIVHDCFGSDDDDEEEAFSIHVDASCRRRRKI